MTLMDLARSESLSTSGTSPAPDETPVLGQFAEMI
jgi:hypothetical protein